MINCEPKALTPRFTLVTAPTTEPVTVADAQAHIFFPAEDSAKVEVLLKAARMKLEHWTGRAFITQTCRISYDVLTASGPMDDFWYTESPRMPANVYIPRMIELPKPPLISVSSIQYFLDDGVEAATTYTSTYYSTSTNGVHGRVMLKTGRTWPTGLRPMDSLYINYTAGYGDDADDVPQPLREAIIELAAHMYENREGQQAANAGGAVVLDRGTFIPAGVQTKAIDYKVVRL